ncbi:MAG: hypothetical protein GKS05_02600 [Nitrospirales bacterium]|nr:hypothetical protein [Nitrospirales bacterium]
MGEAYTTSAQALDKDFEREFIEPFKTHVPRILGAAVFFLVGIAMLIVAFNLNDSKAMWGFIIQSLIIISSGIVFLVFVYFRRSWCGLQSLIDQQKNFKKFSELPQLTKKIILFSLAANPVGMIIFSTWEQKISSYFGSPAIVLLGFALLVPQ